MAVKLAKEMYQQARKQGITFSELLAIEAPSSHEGLDAFEFALMDRDINLKKDTVEKFYRTSEDSVLFPEFINRNVRIGIAGLGRFDLTLEELIATTTTIDSGVYESVNAQFDAKKIDFKRVTEGAPFPTVAITIDKNTIKLAKLGIALDVSYEVLRRMKLPLLAIHMQLIGQRLAKRNVAYAMYNIINGDGNNNAAPATNAAAISYDALLEFFLDMETWEATVWTAKTALLKTMLKLNEFKDPLLFDTAKSGKIAPAFGNDLKRFNWTETTLGDKNLVAVAKNAALELVKESGAELIETDKVIDKQLEKTVISNVLGFSRIFTDAAYVFTQQ
ncbi:MAG: hypothetical protein WA003_08225 [Desulfuromonadaceae bacterium]